MYNDFRFWRPYLFPVSQDDRQVGTGINEAPDLENISTAARIS